MSFRLKTILGIATIETLLLAILVGSCLKLLHDSNEEELYRRASIATALLATATKNYLSSNDLSVLQQFVAEIVEHPGFVYARISGTQGNLVTGGDPTVLARPFEPDQQFNIITDNIFDTYVDIVNNGIFVGRVEIGLSIQPTLHLLERAKMQTIGLALLEVALAALFSLILGNYLTRQLLELEEASLAVAHGQWGLQLTVRHQDELGRVILAFNTMSERLGTIYNELKQSLVTLNRSEQHHRAVMNSVLDGIITIDRNGIIHSFNSSAEKIFGYNSSEMIGGDVNILIPEPYRSLHNVCFQHYLETREVKIIDQGRVEVIGQRQNGSQFPLELAITEVFLENGEQLLIGAVRDITERHQTEEKLRKLFRAVEQSPNTIVITDLQGTIEFVNPAFLKSTGYLYEEAIGNNPRVLKSGKMSTEVYQELWNTIRRGEVWQGELVNRRKDGEFYWESVSISPIRDKMGTVTHYVAIKEDITKRKEAEEQLRQSEAKFRTLYESSDDAVMLLDETGLFDCNQATLTMFGYSNKKQMMQLHPADLSPPSQPDYLNTFKGYHEYTQNVSKGSSHRFEWLHWKADKTIFPAEVLLNSLELDGYLVLQVVIRDITERKQAEEQIQQAHEEITTLNQKLEKENLRMKAELEITRRLQEMILPKKQELEQIEGLEIASFMKPAEEVGGDYYDISEHQGCIKISIGDVTGHGLESGILMLMVQTAVRTLLVHRETNLVKILSTINRTIYDNVQRMNIDKNLSLCLLDYHAGELLFAGQHESLIVVRNGKIELIDTLNLGFPIGLEQDISDFISESKIYLTYGDVVVLYTDGITEATNEYKKLYGLDQLCKVISRCWHYPAEGIKQAIINDIQRFIGHKKVFDDMTLVVLKQN